MFFSSVVSVSAIEEDDDGDGDITQFSESQLEKMKSTCMEVDQKGSLDSLKFKDTNLWLMCTQLILEEKTK